MPRVFISHSSKDNIAALAFQRWLVVHGWSEEDIFIDLHDIGAGERWRDTLRKASATCEAVIFLASPESLASAECRKELELAEALGKEIIPAILRDLTKADPRLAHLADRQFVDLSAEPREPVDSIQFGGSGHTVAFNKQAIVSIKTRLEDLGVAPGSFLWPPKSCPGAEPYPGLSALTEDDAGIFFGRDVDIMKGLAELRLVRRRGEPRFVVVQAASGAGKSSYLHAGLWPRLERERGLVPLAIIRPAQGILTGPQGLGTGIARWLQRHGKVRPAPDINSALSEGGEAVGRRVLASLLAEVRAIATDERRLANPAAQAPSLLIAIDQGEELFAAENATESNRLLNWLAAFLLSTRTGLDLFVLITIRADSVDRLLKLTAELGFDAPRSILLPPLSPGAYRDVITKPAEVFARTVGRLSVEPELTNQLITDATGADALPLLAFTLSQLFKAGHMSGELTLAQLNALGGMGGCVTRELRQAQAAAGLAGTDADLKRLIVPGLATWDPAAHAAKRLVAREADLCGGDRASLASLANALVQARLLTRNSDTLEVAHEALLRQQPIAGWLEDQKDNLKRRDDVLREAGEWAHPTHYPTGDLLLLRRGERLQGALALAASPDFATALAPARAYLAACHKAETAASKRLRRTQTAIYTLLLGIIASLLGVIFKAEIEQVYFTLLTERRYIASAITPHVLTPAEEKSLAPGASFRECAKDCPEMIVVPAGSYWMGSPESDPKSSDDERPRHRVEIAKPFAVGKFEVTWDDWDACVSMRGCDGTPTADQGWGRGQRPVVNVSWEQAKAYVAWLSHATGKPYRLLSEAEWEYVARAVTSADAQHFIYPWGDTPSHEHANYGTDTCCKEKVEGRDQWPFTAPVGQFPANAFGVHDMHGNVWERVEDTWHGSYVGAPSDGSAWIGGADPTERVVRGGSWYDIPDYLRSADHWKNKTDARDGAIGFRVARTISSP